MEKQDVITIRNNLIGSNENIPYLVTCDNMILYRHPSDILHWDDGKGILTVLKLTQDCTYDENSMYTISSTAYENIQFIDAYYSEKGAEAAIGRFGFTAALKEKAAKFFYKMRRVKATGEYL